MWLVAYIVSYGLAEHVRDSRPRASVVRHAVDRAAPYVFWPLDAVLIYGPRPARGLLSWYLGLWTADLAYGAASD